MDAAITQKKQRVSVACLPCRKKRMRCDGTQPRCHVCYEKAIDCEYTSEDSKHKPPSKRYVESLHARIKNHEDQLAAAGQEVSAFQPAENLDADRDDRETIEPDQRDPVWEISQLVGRLNVGSDGQLHYFGSQSNFNLLHGELSNPTPGTSWLAMRKHGLDAAAQLNRLVSISEDLQDHLLELYWKWQNAWNYIVHKPAFMRDLRAGHGKFCSPLLLSAILAIASRLMDTFNGLVHSITLKSC